MGLETSPAPGVLAVHRMGIEAPHEAIAYMHHDCPACKSEGFRTYGRVLIQHEGREVVCALHIVEAPLLETHQVGLSEAAWALLEAREGDRVQVKHVPIAASERHLRAKVYGRRLDQDAFDSIMTDIVAHRYSTAQLAAFVAACAAGGLDTAETCSLTNAMVASGRRIDWGPGIVADKHCIGGLPGNRTSPIVVAICAAAGVRMPKTSSRAITSPAGTADTMGTLTNVRLDLATMKRVVLAQGACLAWGGSVILSPADDLLIHVERSLDIDSPGQLVASVLSKKIAAGSTHVVIDIPVGPTAKIRDDAAFQAVSALFQAVGAATGIKVHVVETDGTQPVGRGVGPALEARDVLAVLRRDADAPPDLGDRSVALAGVVLELAGKAQAGEGAILAATLLASGAAWEKFQSICRAQGSLKVPPMARHQHTITSSSAGKVTSIDNRGLARLAKLAGAPDEPAAGLVLNVRVGMAVEAGGPMFTLHAESPGALAYALAHLHKEGNPVGISP